jgi:RNA polymerase sigma-70 factor (ECF subfamily)
LINAFDEDFQRIRQYQKGDHEAFATLFHKYYPMVYRIFRIKGLTEADADDMTEEIFIKLIRALKTYQFKKPFDNYLRRVVRNKMIDFYRRKRNYAFIECELIPDRAESQVDYEELRDIISHCLRKIINLTRRSILVLWIDGYKRSQMADLLNIPIGTVHSNLERGKVVLRKCIEDRLK